MAGSKSYLPDKADILTTIQATAPAKKKGGPTAAVAAVDAPKFKIIRTKILDPYETQHPTEVIAATALAARAMSDNFAGTARKAAKLSVAPGAVKKFDDVAALLATLPSHKTMKDKHISTDAKSNRVPEEKKNVRLDVWLYAASREKDNDFHLILGDDPDADDGKFLTAEVSGLPPNDPLRTKLKAVRDSFSRIVNDDLPGMGYDFYDPPQMVSVEGSLFWDASHATGSRPGPPSAKPPTVWEIHPITSIKAR